MEKLLKGLRIFVYDDDTMEQMCILDYCRTYYEFQELFNKRYPKYKLGYTNLEDDMERFTEINDEASFQQALDNKTGKGLSIRLKKPIVRRDSWRCIRCQSTFTNQEMEKCSLCHLVRS